MKKQHLISIFFLLFQLSDLPAESFEPLAYIHTDRHCYVSGDLAYVKAYVPFNFHDSLAQTLYIDLISPAHHFIAGELVTLTHGLAPGYFPLPDSLSTGKYTLRVYTENSKNTTQKIIGKKTIFISNRFGGNEKVFSDTDNKQLPDHQKNSNKNRDCTIALQKTSFAKREKVTLDISSEKMAFVSLTVKPVSELEKTYNKLNSAIESTQLTHNQNIPIDGNTTSAGTKIRGKITSALNNSPLKKTVVLLTFQDTLIRLRYAISNNEGDFCFHLQDYYNQQTVFLSAYSYPDLKPLKEARFKLIDNFLSTNPEQSKTLKVIGFKPGTDTLNVLKSVVKKAYQQEENSFASLNQKAANPYESIFLAGELTHSVYLDDYVELPNFVEIAKEILPYIKYREKEGQYKLSVVDGKADKIREHPFVFIDGVPLFDYNKLEKLSSTKLKRIDVRSEPRVFGDIVFNNGMIFLWTRKGNPYVFFRTEFQPEATIQCHQLPLSNYRVNNRPAVEKNMPDFRHVLHWEPEILLEKESPQQVSFFTSDEEGSFELVLEGFTNDGEAISIHKTITVK